MKWHWIPRRAQAAHQLAVAADIELEDQGKPDQDRIDLLGGLDDLFRFLLDVDDTDVVAGLPQHGREIAEAEVSLVLKPDEHDRARGVAPAPDVKVAVVDRAERNGLAHAIVQVGAASHDSDGR